MDPNVGQLERHALSEVTPFKGNAVVRSHIYFHKEFNGNHDNNDNQCLRSSYVMVRYKFILTFLPRPHVFLSDSLQGDIPQTSASGMQ